jgi:Pentapeptide repeats (8 copies)
MSCWSELTRQAHRAGRLRLIRSAWLSAMSPPALAPTRPELPEQLEQIELATDFMQARLESVAFHGCDLTNGDFRGAKLKRCELRRSDLTGVQGVESLRGLAMEWPDIVELAGVWAAALGIEVLEPGD